MAQNCLEMPPVIPGGVPTGPVIRFCLQSIPESMRLPSLSVPEEMRNVGGLDRSVRGAAGIVALVAGLAAIVAGRSTLGTVVFVAGVGLLFNAVTQFCGVNAVLGVDTCSRSGESD